MSGGTVDGQTVGPRRVVVLGLGNVLMGDDALGPAAVRTVSARYEFDPGVSVIDAGTPGLDLTPFLLGQDAAIVVDTVNATGAAGEVRLYRSDELRAAPAGPRLSPHDPGLKEALLLLDLHGNGPRDFLLVGVIPERVERGIGMSEPVRQAIPEVETVVLAELDRLGVAAREKAAPEEPDLWWERA